MRAAVTMLAREPVEGVPHGLLIGDINTPLNIDQRCGVAAAFNRVAELERAPLRMLVIVNVNLETRGLAFDSPFRVLELRDTDFGFAIEGQQGITLRITRDGQRSRFLR